MERRSILSIVGGLGAAAISGDRDQQTFGCWAVRPGCFRASLRRDRCLAA